jgi:hypothetical protein
MKCNFTYDHYKECINLGKELGYSFFSMHDFLSKKPKNNFIVMRHDVDLSLKHALAMAEVEKSLGVSVTYFIRVDGIFNPFDGENLELLKKISKLGHEIGYHYEFKGDSSANFKKYFLDNNKKFETLLGVKVFGAALHKTKSINNSDKMNKLNIAEKFLPELDIEYDAYSDIFMQKMKFISDSQYRWREGCMCNHIKNNTKLCILTHPIWWSSRTTSLVSLIEELF